jgi:N-acetylglucosaminyl-diphospho-decaprenol L-rhamnosyltransferase
MASSSAPAVAVVTVSYGSSAVLAPFLASLSRATVGPLEIVVADNQPDDEDVASLAAEYGAKHLVMPSNVGYGSAVNAAVETLPNSVEWILIANPDLVMGEGSIDALFRTGMTDDRIADVGPATLTAAGDVYPSARAIPSLRTGVGHALFFRVWPANPWSRAYLQDTSAKLEQRDAGWLSGACALVRRSSFAEIGGFDTHYFMYFEDVDLGYRFGKRGYRNVYEPSATVTHTGAHSTDSNQSRMVAEHHRSAERFLRKKYSRPILLPIRIGLSLGLRARSALVQHNLER